MQLLASVPAASTIAITFAAAAGMIGAIIALLKLKPEANESAVLQAQGAMETMVALNEQMERELERANERAARANDRADQALLQLADLQEEHERIVELWGPFPAATDRPA